MNFSSALNFGDKAWIFGDAPREVTIGQIRITATSTPGIYEDGEDGIQFDNYKAVSDYEEVYMCVETGVGSGSLWTFGKNIFMTREACIEANQQAIQQREQAKAECRRLDIERAKHRKIDAEAELRRLGVSL